MKISIRQAEAGDIDILLRFEKGIVEAEKPFDETLKSGEIHYYDLLELIQSGEAEVAVAVSGSRIVGSGYANIVQAKPYQAFHQYAHLGFMYVLPDFRGQGVNRMILEYLIEWANQKGIHEIQLEVYAENTIALKAYRRYGFAPSVLQMRLDTCRRANANPDT